MSEEQANRAVRRYETGVVTLIGVLALCISAYTAYMQRQQVRAAVWPILEFSTSNEPNIRLTLDNKGVGPAIIRHVFVKVDGQPVRTWYEAMQKLLGPAKCKFSESDMNTHVLSAGESMNILVPHDDENNPLVPNKSGPLGIAMDKARRRVEVEICYSSTLGESWTLRSGGDGPSSTVETRTCPGQSATSFQQ